MVVPKHEAEAIKHLIAHKKTTVTDCNIAHRTINGKMSEIAAAFILDRLHRAPEWMPLYKMLAHFAAFQGDLTAAKRVDGRREPDAFSASSFHFLPPIWFKTSPII